VIYIRKKKTKIETVCLKRHISTNFISLRVALPFPTASLRKMSDLTSHIFRSLDGALDFLSPGPQDAEDSTKICFELIPSNLEVEHLDFLKPGYQDAEDSTKICFELIPRNLEVEQMYLQLNEKKISPEDKIIFQETKDLDGPKSDNSFVDVVLTGFTTYFPETFAVWIKHKEEDFCGLIDSSFTGHVCMLKRSTIQKLSNDQAEGSWATQMWFAVAEVDTERLPADPRGDAGIDQVLEEEIKIQAGSETSFSFTPNADGILTPRSGLFLHKSIFLLQQLVFARKPIIVSLKNIGNEDVILVAQSRFAQIVPVKRQWIGEDGIVPCSGLVINQETSDIIGFHQQNHQLLPVSHASSQSTGSSPLIVLKFKTSFEMESTEYLTDLKELRKNSFRGTKGFGSSGAF